MPLPVPDPNLPPVQRLVAIMAALRGPGGCPWDIEQTHRSIQQQLIEECYEVVDAIEAGDPEELREELGDLMLHVAFHARIAEEAGQFTFDDAARGIVEKLIRRHPHVFGDDSAADSTEVLKNWDQIKKGEKPERSSALDGVPRHAPALMRAQETQKKAAKVGFDWPDSAGPREKIAEELRELAAEIEAGAPKERIVDEAGDLLFAAVNYLRHLKVDSEVALHGATRKFEARFRAVEEAARAQGKELKGMTLEEMDALWNMVKKQVGS